MASVVTTNGSIVCIHGGVLTATPSQSGLTVAGAPVLVVTDLLTAVVAGCQNKPPCVSVTGLSAGGSALLSVAGTPVVLATTAGTTNAGTFQVQAPGQNTLDA